MVDSDELNEPRVNTNEVLATNADFIDFSNSDRLLFGAAENSATVIAAVGVGEWERCLASRVECSLQQIRDLVLELTVNIAANDALVRLSRNPNFFGLLCERLN